MTVLGLDTSNYRTSAALISTDGQVQMNYRELLPVSPGERGLRQNEAVFAHLKQLGAAGDMLRQAGDGQIAAIGASVAPRDGNDSYMPVFQAGASFGKLMAAMLHIPFVATTHQRGHLAAAALGTELEEADRYLALHLSGGTTDLLEVREEAVHLIGGSLDLHAGQLVDRAGVALGMRFPAGPELEALAQRGKSKSLLGCSMCNDDLSCHLSGAESQVQRWIRAQEQAPEDIAREIYDFLARTVSRLIIAGQKKTGLGSVLITGGIASSALFRKMLAERIAGRGGAPRLFFGKPELSGDNAVGVAFIALKAWQKGQQ